MMFETNYTVTLPSASCGHRITILAPPKTTVVVWPIGVTLAPDESITVHYGTQGWTTLDLDQTQFIADAPPRAKRRAQWKQPPLARLRPNK